MPPKIHLNGRHRSVQQLLHSCAYGVAAATGIKMGTDIIADQMPDVQEYAGTALIGCVLGIVTRGKI